jgi:ubiquinone/menaquinone biosynthesis C-methylase UbiE
MERIKNMHRMRNEPKIKGGPETRGITIHWARHYDIFSGLMGMGTNRPNSRMVIELAQVKAGDKVLDVGCGTGSLTLTAKTYAGAEGAVYGIDAAPEMIEAAQKKATQAGMQVNFEVGLIEKLDFEAASFDVVISRLAIHHLPDDLKSRGFAEILRVLKPGGRLLIADFKPPSNPLLRHLSQAVIGGHMMQSDIGDLPRMLVEAGFVEVHSGPTRSSFLGYVSGKKAG